MNYKKYAFISIVMNILLLLIYFICFHHRKPFSGHEEIRNSLTMANEHMEKSNSNLKDGVDYVLERKPKMQTPYNDLFCSSHAWVEDFSCSIESEMNASEISNARMKEIYENYESTLKILADLYKSKVWEVRKEAKMPKAEVKAKIDNFNGNLLEGQLIERADIENLSIEGKKTLLYGMKNYLRIVETWIIGDFCGLIGGRYHRMRSRYFPVAFSYNSEIRLGDTFESKLGVGGFVGSSWERSKYFSVYINGKKIETKENKAEIQLETDSLGDKEIEAIVLWANPSKSKGYQSDTTIIKYTVTP